MEIKSPNRQEMHWIREMSMISYIFLFDTVRVPVFYLSKNRTENRFLVPVCAVNRVPVHKTTNRAVPCSGKPTSQF